MRLDKPQGYASSPAMISAMESFRWTASFLKLEIDNRKADEITRQSSKKYFYEDATHRVDVFVVEPLVTARVKYYEKRTNREIITEVNLTNLVVTVERDETRKPKMVNPQILNIVQYVNK
jgi:hypothetical protein